MVGGEFEETVKVNRWKRKADECSVACHLSTPRRPPSPSLHHLASGFWTTALDGGASVLSVLSRCLWVYYQLALPWRSPAASHSEGFNTHRNTNTHASTQARRSIWTLFTFCSLSSSYVGLFVAAAPELGEENRENKAEGKKQGWRKEGRGGGGGNEEGGDEWEREREGRS